MSTLVEKVREALEKQPQGSALECIKTMDSRTEIILKLVAALESVQRDVNKHGCLAYSTEDLMNETLADLKDTLGVKE